MLGYGRMRGRCGALELARPNPIAPARLGLHTTALFAVFAFVTACGSDAAGRGDTSAVSTAGRSPTSASLAVRAAQRCDASDVSTVIDSAGIGPVLLRARVGSLATRCTVIDTTLMSSEGAQERAHVVSVANGTLLVLSTSTPDTSIIRVITTDRRFRTTGGVGVGSSVESLRLAHGSLCAAQGEGNFVVTAANVPGVSFAIDWNPPPSREPAAAETPFPGGDPGTALDASRIIRIWVHGVVGGCRVGRG